MSIAKGDFGMMRISISTHSFPRIQLAFHPFKGRGWVRWLRRSRGGLAIAFTLSLLAFPLASGGLSQGGASPASTGTDAEGARWLLGAIALLVWLGSGYGYYRAKRRYGEQFKLNPEGRSQVHGHYDHRDEAGLFSWSYGISVGAALGLLLALYALWQPWLGEVLDLGLITALGLMLLLSIAIAFFAYRIPEDRLKAFIKRGTWRCRHCDSPLESVSWKDGGDRLGRAQRVAQDLGSTRIELWHCSHCFPQDSSRVHRRDYILNAIDVQECPHCHELTMTRSQTVEDEATESGPGVRHVGYTCQACGYQEEREELMTAKGKLSYDRIDSSHRPAADLDRHTGVDGWAGGGFGSGGGSFGGGASGGGGAGGNS
ncbi:MAG: hypothetical protein EA395_16510 [Phormidium sp. GEM2.Bin31]|nr:MAG: hypothetical protein EA395_16510 [Phormidium sp. GEM2.Bin31]